MTKKQSLQEHGCGVYLKCVRNGIILMSKNTLLYYMPFNTFMSTEQIPQRGLYTVYASM